MLEFDSEGLRQRTIDLLQPFYDCRSGFGAEVLVNLVECMGMLTKVKTIFVLFCFVVMYHNFSWMKHFHGQSGTVNMPLSGYWNLLLRTIMK